MSEKYDGGSNHGDEVDQQLVFERPKGIKGVYYHPITQV
jgi:hypothetical protein